jgi:polysaccharide export outer membrane protein
MNSMTRVLRMGAVVFLTSGVWAVAGQDRHNRPATDAGHQPANSDLIAAWEKGSGRPALQRRDPRYQIETGDVLELSFPFSPEFNRTVTVQPDGYISLLGAGDLHVAGKTTPELAERLKEVYGKILRDPVVTVELKEFEKPYFVAAGAVIRPGKYDLHGFTTATQAVAVAGGFNDDAKHSEVLLFRRASNNWVEVKKLNLKKMLQARDLSEDVALQPGDMLFVPKSTMGKIRRYIPVPTVGTFLSPGL